MSAHTGTESTHRPCPKRMWHAQGAVLTVLLLASALVARPTAAQPETDGAPPRDADTVADAGAVPDTDGTTEAGTDASPEPDGASVADTEAPPPADTHTATDTEEPRPEDQPDARDPARWTVAGVAGAEANVTPAFTGHGFLAVQAARSETLGGTLRLTYNTDTLDATLERLPLAERLELTIGLRGEALIAGLNMDYFQRGRRLGERGFYASYLQGHARLQAHLPARNTLELETQVRRWWFRQVGDDSVVLPQETWHTQLRLAWIYWNIQVPAAEWEAHRVFQRVEGFAFRVAGDLLMRGRAGAFGAEVAPGQLDPRNDAGRMAATVRLWAAAGVRSGALRVAGELNGAWGTGHDDITRDRLGGLTPYVVRIPGLPWAALLSERYLVGEGRVALGVGRDRTHELGVLLAGGVVNDPRRDGTREPGLVGGGALFMDLRFGNWQLHAQGAMATPVGWLRGGPYLSGLGTVGVRLR